MCGSAKSEAKELIQRKVDGLFEDGAGGFRRIRFEMLTKTRGVPILKFGLPERLN